MQIPQQENIKHRSPFKGFLPFFWLALACLGGILLADWLNLSSWVWGINFSLSLFVGLLTLFLPKTLAITHHIIKMTRSDNRLPGTILAAVFFLGGWRYTATQVQITSGHAAYFNNRGTIELIGTLVQPPDPRDSYTNLMVEVETLTVLVNEHPQGEPLAVSGAVLVQAQSSGAWTYGDRLQINGQLETPFESADFSYRDYLARRGILSIMPYARVKILAANQGNPIKDRLFRLRDKGHETVQKLFPSPESDLLSGILLGIDQGLSADLQAAFRKTGTTHIIAISGFNIAILAGLFSGVFTRLLGRKWGAFTAIIGIAAFTVLVGSEAAVVRAAIMGGLGVFGGMFGRRQNGLNSLGLAALVMVLIEPNITWDIGFQLSAAATLGLVLYAQPLEEWFVQLAERRLTEAQAQKLVGPLSEFLLFTLAAQVMTLPIIAYHFGGISWLALIANPLILPPQSLVLILGGLAMLAGMLLPGLGAVLTVIALPFVRYTVRMVTWLAHLPGGDIVLPKFHVLWLLLFYGLLFVITLLPTEQRQSFRKKILSYQSGLLVFAGLAVFIWNRVLTLPDGILHLTLLDAEGTVLVQTPDGNAVLVGGGPSPSFLKQALGQLLPAGNPHLESLIVGSADRDDLNGLTGGLLNTPVEMALWGIDPEANQTSRAVHSLLTEKGTPMILLKTGQTIHLGEGISINVVWADERGTILWLEWENFSALLPSGKVKEHWLSVPSAPDVVLLPDNISADTLHLGQINSWASSVILLPLDESDTPLQGEHELLLTMAGYPLLSTLDHGWVRISTDGKQLWVNSEW